MQYIRSAQNQKVKQWKKLQTKKEREKAGLFLVEGFHLVEEALKNGQIKEIIIQDGLDLPPNFDFADIPITIVSAEIFKDLADTETPQGIIAVAYCQKEQIMKGKQFLLLDAIQDPGNLGTIIRTADAAGIDGVIVGEGSVDIYNPKVVRSAQGSHFHLPIIKGNLFEWVEKLKDEDIPIYGTSLKNGQPFTEIQPKGPFALIVGNEGNGVKEKLLEETDHNLYIPIYGKSESLNVAVATGILLYYLKETTS